MEFQYGEGSFIEGSKNIKGTITLGEHKLFLKSPEGDITDTYVPLDKIEQLSKQKNRIIVHVRLTLSHRYIAAFEGKSKEINELTKDIVNRRGLKKKFLKNEWFEEAA